MSSSDFQAEIILDCAVVKLRIDGIIEFIQNPVTIGLEEVKECHAAMDSLNVEAPYLLLVEVPLGASSTKEGREYASKESIRNRIKAQAIVVGNLSTRILANFYMKVNRPRQPIKIFTDRASAIQWLHEQK